MINKIYKYFFERRFVFKSLIFGAPIILNYSIGKTGSRSVDSFLRKNKIYHWHIHRFDFTKIYKMKLNIFAIYVDKFLLYLLKKRIKKLYIITGFRGQFNRDLSMYLYHNPINSLSINEHKNFFINHFPINQFHNWITKDFNKSFNVDLYKYKFNSSGYFTMRVISNSLDTNIFIYKLSQLSELESIIKKFLNLKDYKLFYDSEIRSESEKAKIKEFEALVFDSYALKTKENDDLKKYDKFYNSS